MRLIVNGQQAFGKAALEAIVEQGRDEVVAVYTAPDREGRPVDPVKQAAIDLGLPVFQPASYKDQAVLDEMHSHNGDLMVMAYVIIFVPEAARNVPRHGTICFHPSLLPLHRGPSSINWPIIGGATKTGLTYFWPDDGLDEGDILLQREVDIGPDDTLGSIYFDKIFPLGIAATLEAIDLVRAGDPPHIAQDDSAATYESWCKKADAGIDWSKPASEVYNLIRGTNPQPGAWTTLSGNEVQIYDCQLQEGFGTPGEVISTTEDGILVQTEGGRVLIKRVRVKGGDKSPAAEWARTAGIEPGSRLGI